jgi:oxazoline/thiazoline dehydrogenase
MSQLLVLSFRKDVALSAKDSTQVVLHLPFGDLTLEQPGAGVLAAFRTLSCDGAAESDLTEMVTRLGGQAESTDFQTYLQKFNSLGLIRYTLRHEDLLLATLTPVSPCWQFNPEAIASGQTYVLSRFAYCHKSGEQMVLESPLAHAYLILHDWRSLALVAELVKPRSYEEVAHIIPGLAADTAKLFFQLLVTAGMVSEAKDGWIQEETNPTLIQWDFHDLLFHARSRLGRHLNPYGANYPFLSQIKPLPALKPQMSPELIALYKPDLEKLKASDYPFTLVLERRKSIRRYADKPLTAKQLGEFLYRAARAKKVIQTDKGELSARPYPSAGARYELELYLIINACESIPAGLYHYDSKDHQLSKLSDPNKYTEALLKGAWLAANQQSMPQVLIIIAARFQRVAWKYQALAYALILKNVGVLYQTMYLVATAMGLSPCALGGGNADLFAHAVGTDYYAETSVGEFLLGGARADQDTIDEPTA